MLKLKPEQEMTLYELHARYVWPFQRLLLRSMLSKRCIRCTLPETYSKLHHGICEICQKNETQTSTQNTQHIKETTSDIDQIFKKYTGSGKNQFDCLLLFSGGKDSIYLLHLLKKKFPDLRILLLLVDNTFLPPNAHLNASLIAEKLRTPYVAIRPSPEFYEKIFRHAFLNLKNKESAVVIDQFDGDILHDIARNYAVRQQIPLIVSGVQAVQVERYVGIHHYETPRSFEESRRTHVAGFQLDSFLNKSDLGYFWDGTQWPKKSIPHMLYPLYAWDYDESNVTEIVAKLGLISKKRLSPLATNHQLLPLMGAVDIAHLGYSSYEPEFANLIRQGKADRKFWQAIFEMQEYAMKTNRFVTGSVNAALDRLSLTRKDLSLPE